MLASYDLLYENIIVLAPRQKKNGRHKTGQGEEKEEKSMGKKGKREKALKKKKKRGEETNGRGSVGREYVVQGIAAWCGLK